jgi:hypothetical protein
MLLRERNRKQGRITWNLTRKSDEIRRQSISQWKKVLEREMQNKTYQRRLFPQSQIVCPASVRRCRCDVDLNSSTSHPFLRYYFPTFSHKKRKSQTQNVVQIWKFAKMRERRIYANLLCSLENDCTKSEVMFRLHSFIVSSNFVLNKLLLTVLLSIVDLGVYFLAVVWMRITFYTFT